MAGNAVSLGPKGWQYSNYSTAAERANRSIQVLRDLVSGAIDAQSVARDTRPVHKKLFEGMHPKELGHLAGEYRGAKFVVLSTYNIQVRGDKSVGVHYSAVANHMSSLADRVDQELAKRSKYVGQTLGGRELVEIVGMSCSLMVKFLTIHPYADGNGHMGRFLIWALLHHFGVHARRWPLDQRPPDPGYFDKIKAYRNNQKKDLIEFVLSHIADVQPAVTTH